MSFRETIHQIKQRFPPANWLNFPLLVAVSGGADSVALLRLLHAIAAQHSPTNINLIVSHINHQLRGNASDEDEAFVSRLADQWGLDFRVDRLAPRLGSHSEESLRVRRYEALLKIARQTGARYLATGHTRDDQAETILFRILRGTGIAGLAGIPPIRVVDKTVSIVRPLLETSRIEIEALLAELNQDFRTDESNLEVQFTRNFLRQELMPQLRNRFGESVPDALVRLGSQAAETELFLEQQAHQQHHAIRSQTPLRVEIALVGLQAAPPILIRQFFKQLWQQQNWPLQSMTFEWWCKLVETVRDPIRTPIQILPGDIRLESYRDRLILLRSG